MTIALVILEDSDLIKIIGLFSFSIFMFHFCLLAALQNPDMSDGIFHRIYLRFFQLFSSSYLFPLEKLDIY